MRKIYLQPYSVTVRDRDGGTKDVEYKVKDSLIEILFNPALRLNGVKLLKQNELAERISKSTEFVLVEEEEYDRIMEALSTFEGMGRNEVEFAKRIINAEKTDI